MSDYRDYENGVADVVALLAGDNATVERNVRMPGRLSGVSRQVDVRITGRMFGLANQVVIIDCKRWGSKVDVADVGSFVDLVRDVGADGGLLITSSGASQGAHTRACAEAQHHIQVLSVDELRRLAPAGTITVSYRINGDDQAVAERSLRNAGLRVVRSMAWPEEDGTIVIDAFRHHGSRRPGVEAWKAQTMSAEHALTRSGVEFAEVMRGITNSGGTPAHKGPERIGAQLEFQRSRQSMSRPTMRMTVARQSAAWR
jgi:hypothetical protein